MQCEGCWIGLGDDLCVTGADSNSGGFIQKDVLTHLNDYILHLVGYWVENPEFEHRHNTGNYHLCALVGQCLLCSLRTKKHLNGLNSLFL